jgi:ATP-dependent DNA ligase
VIIAGWKPGGAPASSAPWFSAYDDAGRLLYVGGVGTGFTHRMLVDLGASFDDCTGRRCRSIARYPADTPETCSGWSRRSWPNSRTATGRRMAGYGIHRGEGYDRTEPQTK